MFKKLGRSVLMLLIIIIVLYVVFKMVGTRTHNYSPENPPLKPYVIGSVDTAFQRIGPDHRIEIGGIPDPKIKGITCFYSRAKTGGIKGGLGVAEDTSDASVACRQTGDIVFEKAIKSGEEIRNESTSFLFKKLRIVRFYDGATNTLIYMVYSDKLIDGSPQNSISVISLGAVQPMIQ